MTRTVAAAAIPSATTSISADTAAKTFKYGACRYNCTNFRTVICIEWYLNNRAVCGNIITVEKISALCVKHGHYKSNTQLKGNRVSEKRIADLPVHADFVPCAFGRWEREVIGLVPTCESGFYQSCDGKAVIF